MTATLPVAAKPLHAARNIETDEWHVDLTIGNAERRAILLGLARALARDNRLVQVLAIGRGPAGSPDIQRALDNMLGGSAGHDALWTLTMTPQQAIDLAEDLTALATEPETCATGSCSSYALDGVGYCGPHAEAVGA